MKKHNGEILINWFKKGLITVTRDGEILSTVTGKPKYFSYDKSGYKRIGIRLPGKKNRKDFQYHQVVWVWFNGLVPEGFEIDHINNQRLDNRLENLQLLKPEDNCRKNR